MTKLTYTTKYYEGNINFVGCRTANPLGKYKFKNLKDVLGSGSSLQFNLEQGLHETQPRFKISLPKTRKSI